MGMDLDCGLVDALTQSFQRAAAARPVGAPSADSPVAGVDAQLRRAPRVERRQRGAVLHLLRRLGDALLCYAVELVRRDRRGPLRPAPHRDRMRAGASSPVQALATTSWKRDALPVRLRGRDQAASAHRHVLSFEAVYERANNAWIVWSLREGGDLLQFLVRPGRGRARPGLHAQSRLRSCLSAATILPPVGRPAPRFKTRERHARVEDLGPPSTGGK